MPRQVEFDFSDAPPAQGGGMVHVPPGEYPMVVVNADDGESSTNKRMVTVSLAIAAGPEAGKELTDRFVLDQPGGFGFKRFHAFLLALGLPVQQKRMRMDLDRMSGLKCLAKIDDETIPASEKYDARIVSRIGIYRDVNGNRPDQPGGSNGAQPQAVAVATMAQPQTQPWTPQPPPQQQAAVAPPQQPQQQWQPQPQPPAPQQWQQPPPLAQQQPPPGAPPGYPAAQPPQQQQWAGAPPPQQQQQPEGFQSLVTDVEDMFQGT